MRINPISSTNSIIPIFKTERNNYNQKKENKSFSVNYKESYKVDISQSGLEFLKLLNNENKLVYDTTIQSYTKDLKLIKK